MAMTHTFDLQRFADSNVQTTGTQSLSAEMKTYYGMELLENAKPALVHNQFAATKPLPVGGGKTVEWRKFGSFDKALTPLTEGVTPDGSGITVSYITKELSQYGDYTTVSDMLDLTAIDDVGPITARYIRQWLESPQSQDLLARLREAGVNMTSHQEKVDDRFAGQTFVLTGTLEKFTRDEAAAMIEQRGGKASGSVSKKTTYVVAGENAGSKLRKAQELNIPVLTEDEFLSMLQ